MASELNDPDLSGLAEGIRLWQSGQQDPALAILRPIAERSAAGGALLAWCLNQRGEPGWREAVPYAKRAVLGGYPHAAGFVVGNMVNDPTLREDGLELARLAAMQGVITVDPVAQAINYAQQNDLRAMSQALSSPWPSPLPLTVEAWDNLVGEARHRSSQIDQTATQMQARADELTTDWTAFDERIRAQATQLMALIAQTTNAEASQVFEEEATTSKAEADRTWRWGVWIIITAAAISVLPLLSHYWQVIFETGPAMTQAQQISVHVTAALALGTLAGVLLARSRVRDRNRQRNTDLRVALRMMFAYAQQIENEGERQQYIQQSGRTVLEAYLRQDSPHLESDGPNLLSALRSSSA